MSWPHEELVQLNDAIAALIDHGEHAHRGPVLHPFQVDTSANAFPITDVASVGSRSCSFVSVARAGAEKYSRKMKNSDHPTERRAERTPTAL